MIYAHVPTADLHKLLTHPSGNIPSGSAIETGKMNHGFPPPGCASRIMLTNKNEVHDGASLAWKISQENWRTCEFRNAQPV
jgi:hypothetical protein